MVDNICPGNNRKNWNFKNYDFEAVVGATKGQQKGQEKINNVYFNSS